MEPGPSHSNIVPCSQCKDIQALQKDKTTLNDSKIFKNFGRISSDL